MGDPFAPTNLSDNPSTYEDLTSPSAPAPEGFNLGPEADVPAAPVPHGFLGATRQDELDATQMWSPTDPPEGFNNDGEQLRLDIDRALKYSKPEDRATLEPKALASSWIGGQLGVDPALVMQDFDKYTEALYGASMLPQTAWGLITDDFKRGIGAIKLGHMGLGLMLGEPSIEEFERIQQAIADMPAMSDQKAPWIVDALGDLANLGTSVGATMLAGLATAKVTGILGAKGFAGGFMLGSFAEAFALTQGNIYVDLATMTHPDSGKPVYQHLFESAANQRVNPETGQLEPIKDMEEFQNEFLKTAALFSSGGGLISALMEIPQIDLLTGGKLMGDIVFKHLGEIAQKAIKDSTIKNAFMRFAINYGSNIAENVMQEIFQESVEWWATEAGSRKIVEELEMAGVPRGTIDQWLSHVNEVFKTTTNAMVFMAAPGAAMQGGSRAIHQKREALSSPDLSWESNADAYFMTVTDINRTTNPNEGDIAETNRTIETSKAQAPIRVIEGPDGTMEVDPADATRLAAYEARGVEQAPVQVTPWRAEMEANMTPERLAQLNDFKSIDGKVVVPNQGTLDRLVEQNPEQFVQTEDGVQMLDPETQELTPLKTEVVAAIDSSDLEKTLGELMAKLDAMPEDLQGRLTDLSDAVITAREGGSIYDLREALGNDELLNEDSLEWLVQNFQIEANAFDSSIAKIEAIADEIVPQRVEESQAFLDEDVLPIDAEKRQRYTALQEELFKYHRVAKTQEAIERINALEAEINELRPFVETPNEEVVRNAVENATPVPDAILRKYKDREWAALEIAHRARLDNSATLYTDAAGYLGDIEGFMNYVLDDFYWYGNEEAQAEFMKSLPEDQEARIDFFTDIVERTYYKTERNLEGFIAAVSTPEGVLSWLKKMPYEAIRGSGVTKKLNDLQRKAGLTKEMMFAVSSVGRSIIPSRAMLDAISKELVVNAGYWQPRFFALAAKSDVDVHRLWQAQNDYEYLVSKYGEPVNDHVPSEPVTKPEAKARIKNDIEAQMRRVGAQVENISTKELDAFFKIAERIAAYNDMDLSTWLDEAFTAEAFGYDPSLAALGVARQFVEDGKLKSKILFSPQADKSTMFHELIHVMRVWLKPEDVKILEESYGIKFLNLAQAFATNTGPTEAQAQLEEDFVEDFLLYAAQGKAPTNDLAKVFQLLKDIMKEVAAFLFGDDGNSIYPIEDDVKAVFDKVLSSELEVKTEINDAETTDSGLDKRISKTQEKIAILKETIKSAREEARLQTEITKKAERAHANEKKSKRDDMWQKRVDERQEKLDNERKRAKELRDKAERLRKEHRKLEREKREAKRLKEKKIKLAKNISKPNSTGINVRIRDKLENLQGLLDPEFRSAAAVAAWEAEFRNIVKKYNDEGMEQLVTHFGMKPRPLNLWTVEQLEQLNEYMEKLRKDGRTYQDQLDAELRAHYRKVREDYVASLNLTTPPLPPLGSVEGKTARKSNVVQWVQFWTWRPSRIFRMLDNWTEGAFYKLFVTETNEKMDESISRTHERRNRGMAKMAELGLTIHGLADTVLINNVKYSRDVMIHVWLGMKNEKSANAIVHGNEISEDSTKLMEAELTAEEKAWGEFMLQEFSENYQRLSNVYELYMNEHMGREKAYFPMLRADKSWETQQEEFWDQFKMRNEHKPSYVDRGFTVKRVDNKNKLQAGIKLGATHVWNEQIEKHEHWIAMGMHVRDLVGVVKRHQFKKPFVSKFGTQGEAFVNKYIEGIANPTLMQAHSGPSMISRRLRKNTAIAYLAYNVLTTLKQIPSIALFMKEVGPHRLVAATAKYLSNYNHYRDFVNSRDPQMLERILTKEMELFRRREKMGVNRGVDALGATGMKMITGIDSVVTHIGWLAVYDKYVQSGGEKEAVRRAQITVLETQPSARSKDLAMIYQDNEFFNWFLMFSNQLNNIWNMTTADIPYMWKQKQYGKMAGIVAGVGISTISMMLLSGWRPGEDEDESFVLNYLQSASNMIPVIGKGLSGGIEGYRKGGVEMFPVGGEAGNLLREVLEHDGKGLDGALVSAMLAAGVTAGLPVTGLVKRPMEAIQERDVLELFGPAFAED